MIFNLTLKAYIFQNPTGTSLQTLSMLNFKLIPCPISATCKMVYAHKINPVINSNSLGLLNWKWLCMIFCIPIGIIAKPSSSTQLKCLLIKMICVSYLFTRSNQMNTTQKLWKITNGILVTLSLKTTLLSMMLKVSTIKQAHPIQMVLMANTQFFKWGLDWKTNLTLHFWNSMLHLIKITTLNQTTKVSVLHQCHHHLLNRSHCWQFSKSFSLLSSSLSLLFSWAGSSYVEKNQLKQKPQNNLETIWWFKKLRHKEPYWNHKGRFENQ